jgi:Flp pilus assembly protein TadG
MPVTFRPLIGDRRGSVAVAFALLLLPILMALGFAIDYSRAIAFKTRFQAAADNAVLAVISPEYRDEGSNKIGSDYFMANLSAVDKSMLAAAPKIAVSKSRTNGIITATVKFEAEVSTTFMRIANVESVEISGAATAENGTKST